MPVFCDDEDEDEDDTRARAARSVGAFFESLAITTRAPNAAVCKNDTVRARSDACNEMSRARPTAGA